MNQDQASSIGISVDTWAGLKPVSEHDHVAVEVPVALVYNGVSHAVMLASPGDLADLALGFSLSEAIAAGPDDVLGIEARQADDGVTVDIELTARAEARLGARRRTLVGTTGCGLCGVESLQQALREVAPVTSSTNVLASVIGQAPGLLGSAQPVRSATGAVHVAAWIGTDGVLNVAREDVGRHNAMDKLIGTLARGERGKGFALISSRASYEMVQKAACVGIDVLVAVSAPTSLAVERAQRLGLTLVGFARGGSFKVYTQPQRILRA